MPKATAKKLNSSATKKCPLNPGLKKVVTKKVRLRLLYLGATPGKGSKTGQEVIDRMMNENPPAVREDAMGEMEFKELSDGKWYSIDDADMGHIHDAVIYWNKDGRKTGAKSKHVRKFMLDSSNYRLEHKSVNRSKGSILGKTNKYKPPLI